MKAITAMLLVLGLVAPDAAMAWDGVRGGQIAQLDVVADGSNYAMRVYLDSQPMCTGSTANWAYMNVSASNYQAFAAFIYSAWLTHRTIAIYTNKDANNYCEIGYVSGQ